jgi:hypothetical protein
VDRLEPLGPGLVEVVREIRVKELGDVNLSSLMNVAMLAGLALLAAAG